jgi:hypothetical protein
MVMGATRLPAAGRALAAAALLAWGPGCADLDAPPAPEQVLGLTASADKIAANGYSIVTIAAQLDPRTRPELRDVTFTTSLGAFVGAAAATPREIVVPAGSEGQALATLRAGTEPGTATVTAEVRSAGAVLAVANLQVTFERAAAADILRVSISEQVAPADGATTTAVIVQLNPDLLPSQQIVSFTTTAGSFSTLGSVVTTDVRAGSDNAARVLLVSPREPATATVTATVSGFVGRTTVTFEAAPPDSLSVSVSGTLKITASFSSKVTVRAQLYREVGTPSRGAEVQFSATDDSSGNAFGYFSGVTPSDASGFSSAEFTPGNTAERGEATIRARVAGTPADGKVKVEIVAP